MSDPPEKLTGYVPNAFVTNRNAIQTFKIFSGEHEDYEDWEHVFLCGLRLQGLHFALDEYKLKAPKDFDHSNAKQNIYDLLSPCLDKVSLGMIRRESKDDGAKALKILRKYYLRTTDQQIFKYWKSLINVRLEDKTISQYFFEIERILSFLNNSGETVSPKLIIVTVLNGLSTKYDHFIEIANQRSPAFSYEELKVALLNQEDLLNK